MQFNFLPSVLSPKVSPALSASLPLSVPLLLPDQMARETVPSQPDVCLVSGCRRKCGPTAAVSVRALAHAEKAKLSGMEEKKRWRRRRRRREETVCELRWLGRSARWYVRLANIEDIYSCLKCASSLKLSRWDVMHFVSILITAITVNCECCFAAISTHKSERAIDVLHLVLSPFVRCICSSAHVMFCVCVCEWDWTLQHWK